MPVLIQTDEAMAQLSNHSHFADSPAYLHRFRQVHVCVCVFVCVYVCIHTHTTGLN